MATQWYATVEGEQKGPLTGAELKQLARDGKVTPDTPVSTTEDGPAGEHGNVRYSQSSLVG